MNKVWCVLGALLALLPVCGHAQDSVGTCAREEVHAHVLQQFELYGPKSVEHEYFGSIYRSSGGIGSAVARSRECRTSGKCIVNTAHAAKQIPQDAKILGEWHTHPHRGSRSLSQLDVRGASYNRHIVCYTAYFSAPSGEIYTWDVNDSSVPTAMASVEMIGRYRHQLTAALP